MQSSGRPNALGMWPGHPVSKIESHSPVQLNKTRVLVLEKGSWEFEIMM
jgi:hypothetical protein